MPLEIAARTQHTTIVRVTHADGHLAYESVFTHEEVGTQVMKWLRGLPFEDRMKALTEIVKGFPAHINAVR